MVLRRGRPVAMATLLLGFTAATAGESVVIYRCSDAGGAVTFQNDVPCPKGAAQVRRVMEVAAPVAAPAIVPTPAVAPRAPPAVVPDVDTRSPASIAIAIPARLPPPPLFECRTWDDRRYLSDLASPPERCAPLQTTGVGGIAGMGAGAACEFVTDQCAPVAADALCDGWRLRLREAEADLRFGRFESRTAAQAEVARVEQVARDSTCGE